VKKTALPLYDSPRQAGVIAINFREEDDELIGAELLHADDDLLLVSRKGQAIRFHADDTQLRPMGRPTSGVTGMKFRGEDELLSMSVIHAGQADPVDPADDVAADPSAESVSDAADDSTEQYVFTVTDGGWAKRSKVSAYRVQGRGGLGIKAMKLHDQRGSLVGAIVVTTRDEVLAIRVSGQVTRSAVGDVPVKGRDTMGVKFVGVKGNDQVIAIARNIERVVVEDQIEPAAEAEAAADAAVDDGVGPGAGPGVGADAATEAAPPVTDAEPQEDSDG
jgi:DNA gyrase subunit A